MTLKNTFFLLILFFSIKLNAKFVGYYNLRDGGMDISSSSLFILPNNEFKIFTGDGFKNGIWKEIDKDKITLTETKTNTIPFRIFGKWNSKNPIITIDVYGLYQSYAMVDFSKDSLSEKSFQPVFNDGANCLENNYYINKKKANSIILLSPLQLIRDSTEGKRDTLIKW